jgi:hypothetical protein
MRLLLALLLLCLPCAAVELVVRLYDKTHRDAVEDRTGCTKTGMIIALRDDGAKYGKDEGPPQYAIIKLPGVKRAEFEKYLLQEMDATGTNVYRARAYKVDLTLLGAADKTTADAITKDGKLDATVITAVSVATTIKTNIVNISTGDRETTTIKP